MPKYQVRVYSPKHIPDDVEVFGEQLHFEPRSILVIPAKYDWPRNAKQELITSGNRTLVKTAEEVADMIVSDACRAGAHFVKLSGDEKEDEAAMHAADRLWNDTYLMQCEATIASWERHVNSVMEGNPGGKPPRPSERAKIAYDFRAKHRKRMDDDRGAFICTTCGRDFASKEAKLGHIEDEHPMVLAREPLAVAVAQPAVQLPKNGKGAKLSKMAEEMGFELTVADRKGLEHEDPDVIADVAVRIAQTKGVKVVKKAAGKEDAGPVEPPKAPEATT